MPLTVQSTTTFRGPSIWSQFPAIRLTVTSGESSVSCSPASVDAISRVVAGLSTSSSPVIHLEPLPSPPPQEPAALLGWLAIDLQRRAGVDVRCFSARPGPSRDLHEIAIQYRYESTGLAAIRLAVRLINHVLFEPDSALDADRAYGRLIAVAASSIHGLPSWSIVKAAEERGIPVTTVDPRGRIIELGNGRFRCRTLGTMTSKTTKLSSMIARDKYLMNRYLREAGLPVPEAALANSADKAAKAADRIGYPVVIKPPDLGDSISVFVDIRTEVELRGRYAEVEPHAANGPGSALIERFISGNIYRALVVNNQVVAVFQRIPASVEGDGNRTVRQLIEDLNRDPRRGAARHDTLKQIVIDDQTEDVLEKQNLTLESIPPTGQRVMLKPQIGHRRDGGTARECTDEIHPENAAILREAALVAGLDTAGIDFVATDLAQSMWTSGGAIIEVNSAPDFSRHLRPSEGEPRNPAVALIDMLFPPGQPVRVPIVAVTGVLKTNAICEFIAWILASAGFAVGMATSEGLYVNGTHRRGIDGAGPGGARRILNSPEVEAAVFEVPPIDIVNSGLGFDYCEVAVVTSLSEATPDGFPPAESVVCRTTSATGTLVLNADDPQVVALTAATAAPVMLYSLDAHNPTIHAHRRQGGRAVVAQANPSGSKLTVAFYDDKHETEIDLPKSTANGDPSTFLPAIAAAIALLIPIETIQSALR